MKHTHFISLVILALLSISVIYSSASDFSRDSELTENEMGESVFLWYDGSTQILHIRAKSSKREQDLHVQVAKTNSQFISEVTFVMDQDNLEFEMDLSGIASGTYRARAYSNYAYGATEFSVR